VALFGVGFFTSFFYATGEMMTRYIHGLEKWLYCGSLHALPMLFWYLVMCSLGYQ
jgi:hypothetical protein